MALTIEEQHETNDLDHDILATREVTFICGHKRVYEDISACQKKLDGTLPTVPQLPVQARQGIRRKAVCRNQLTRTPRDVAQRNPSY